MNKSEVIKGDGFTSYNVTLHRKEGETNEELQARAEAELKRLELAEAESEKGGK